MLYIKTDILRLKPVQEDAQPTVSDLDQQFKTHKYLVYCHIWQRTAANPHIWEVATKDFTEILYKIFKIVIINFSWLIN